MSQIEAIEARLEAVEKELAQLKRMLRQSGSLRSYKAMIGSMKDFPEFDEVVRLGREARLAQRDYAEPAE